jgi:hypothetical protein
MKLLKYKGFAIGALLIGLGIGIGWFSKPTKTVTKTEIKEVVKVVETKQENKDVKVTKKKTTKKDGEVIEETTIEDKSRTDTKVDASSEKETKKERLVTNNKGLTLSALVLARDSSISEYEYGIAVSKRILGNISVGIVATEKRALGLTLGLEF